MNSEVKNAVNIQVNPKRMLGIAAIIVIAVAFSLQFIPDDPKRFWPALFGAGCFSDYLYILDETHLRGTDIGIFDGIYHGRKNRIFYGIYRCTFKCDDE